MILYERLLAALFDGDFGMMFSLPYFVSLKLDQHIISRLREPAAQPQATMNRVRLIIAKNTNICPPQGFGRFERPPNATSSPP